MATAQFNPAPRALCGSVPGFVGADWHLLGHLEYAFVAHGTGLNNGIVKKERYMHKSPNLLYGQKKLFM